MRHSWLTPTLGALFAAVIVAVVAGLFEWSATAIYAGLFGVGLVTAALVLWADPGGALRDQ